VSNGARIGARVADRGQAAVTRAAPVTASAPQGSVPATQGDTADAVPGAGLLMRGHSKSDLVVSEIGSQSAYGQN
jgi:hypothetical protein